MEQVPWDRRISRAHPSKEHLRANRDRNINKDFLFKKKKIFTCLEDEPSHVVAATQSTCSEATGNFLDGENSPAGKTGWPERKPSLSWENVACVDKNATN